MSHSSDIDAFAFRGEARDVFGPEAVAYCTNLLAAVGGLHLFDDGFDYGVSLVGPVAFAVGAFVEPFHYVEAFWGVEFYGVAFEEVGDYYEVAVFGEVVGEAGVVLVVLRE